MMAGPWEKYQRGNQQGGSDGAPWEKYKSQGQSDQKPKSEPLTFLNRAIADVLGAPADLVNMAPMAANILPGEQGIGPISERPIGGSQSIAEGMRGVGVDVAQRGEQPDTPAEYVARGVGEAAGALVPFYGAAGRVAQAGRGAMGSAARQVTQSAARRPVTTVGGEAAAGAGAGAGAAAGREYGGDDTSEALGELAGGLTVGLAPSAFMGTLRRTPVAGTALRAGQRAVFPFTEAGGRARASDRLRALSSDPEADAAAMNQESIGGLTASQQTGNPRLMALERLVLEQDANLADDFERASAESTRMLREAIEEQAQGGQVGDAVGFVQQRRDRLMNALDARLRQARDLARQRIAQLEPSQTKSQASTIVREEIEKALDDARQQESRLWEAIPDEVELPTANVRTEYQELRDNLPRAQREDIPDIARRFLEEDSNERLQSQETVKELRGLYSKLGEVERVAKSRNANNTARIATRLRKAILSDLGAHDAEGEVGEYINAARTFSRRLNERFTEGAVGRVLGQAREGGDRVPPETTLDVTTGRGGPRAGVETRQVLEGTAESTDTMQAGTEEALSGVENYLRNRFADAAVRDGRVRSGSARRFLRENAEALEQFPDLRRQMQEAAQSQDTVDELAQRFRRVEQRLTPQRSNLQRFLDAPVEQEIDQVLKARNPRRAAQTLRNAVAKDKSGQALKGLKRGFVDYMIRNAATRDFDQQGQQMLSGGALKNILSAPRARNAMKEVFTPAEMRRFDRIADELGKLEASRKNLPNVGQDVMEDATNSILNYAGAVLAARGGSAAGGSTMAGGLQAAQMASGRAREFLQNLTNDKAAQLISDAVTGDRELYRTLLMDMSTPGKAKVVNRRLNAWLAGPGATYLTDQNEDDQPPSITINRFRREEGGPQANGSSQ